jgi:type I restriction enzyme S subunit
MNSAASSLKSIISCPSAMSLRRSSRRSAKAARHLNGAVLDRLLAACAPGEFAQGWRCISDNFDLLYDAPENVGVLRKAILQLAVMGKLVEQDANDEPAEVLVERIKDENKIQMKNQINKNTPLFSPIRLTPFELPENWKWCRMGEIAEIIMGNSPPGDSYNENGNGIPLINGPVEFSKGHFGYTIKSKFTTKPTKLCKENDLLICVRGSTTGRTNIAGFQACIGRGVAVIRARIHQQYVNYLVLSMRQQIYDLGTGSTFPSVSYGQFRDLPIPLPPLAEQRRIVARVDQVMSLCDELEAGLLRLQADSERLMEAVVGRMLAGGDCVEGQNNTRC